MIPIFCHLLGASLDHHVQAAASMMDGHKQEQQDYSSAKSMLRHSLMQRDLHAEMHNKNHQHHQKNDPRFSVDISPYSLRFEKCQGIKTGQEQQPVRRFAVFRLCPRHECSTCQANYGEYTLPLEDYLGILSTYFHETKSKLCETCTHCLEPDQKDTAESKLEDFNSNCVHCSEECTTLDKIQQSSGYVDATDFLKCSLVHTSANGEKHYAGPVCSQGGDAVAIGVFTDEYCAVQDMSQDIRDILKIEKGNSVQLASSFLKLSYLETCLSCAEDGVEGMHDDIQANPRNADKVKGFCKNIYQQASKCESPHGFAAGKTPPTGETTADEKQVCDFIGTIHSNKHSNPEQFIADETAALEAFAEEEVMDAQSLIIIIVGGVLVILYAMFKCFCNSNARMYRISPISDDGIHSFDMDDQIIKVADSGEDVEGTEEESSDHTQLETASSD